MLIARNMKTLTLSVACLMTAIGAGAETAPDSGPVYEVVTASAVEWEHLNPARGDKSPRAGTLWGDRNGTDATGFLVKFVDGFSSPPHIHNVSYRGVVIEGLVHNDDPDAAAMWMPVGSFWTQPKGEAHITAAKGSVNVAYIEIEEGPYLVKPAPEAFDSGERPINVDVSNTVWVDLPGSSAGPKVAYLWGTPRAGQLNGTLVKLPAGFTGDIRSHGAGFRAVVIQGPLDHRVPDGNEAVSLEPGSYFSSRGKAIHRIGSGSGKGCLLYVRAEGAFEIMKAD